MEIDVDDRTITENVNQDLSSSVQLEWAGDEDGGVVFHTCRSF